VADDREALVELRRVLRPGGHLLLFVPALPAVFSPMDEALGHHRRYTLAELRAKVVEAGFTVPSAGYRDLLGVAAWWLVHRVMGNTGFNRQAAKFYDRVGVPLTRGIERLMGAPIGKNILMVARA
jgi:SAM-dependent methyltransferase